MKQFSYFLSGCVSLLCGMHSIALANEVAPGDTLTVQQASQLLYYSAGNDRFRVELAPNYSQDFGFSLRGSAGGYLTDAMALGLIVEYGVDKREYLGNAGIQFNDALSLVGTVGMLEEHYEYVPGAGKDTVQQMEYGASLKGAYEVGILSGFALNGYLTSADGDSKNVETGKLYGIQLVTDVDLTDTTHVKLGGGYEWLAWDNGGNNDSFAFSAEGSQQFGDMLSINASAKLGASEYVYAGGIALDFSSGGGNTNSLALNYSYIVGRDGIEDDQRVELGWSYGFGAGPTRSATVETQDTGLVRPVADVAMVSPANNLLNDVMKRPSYLPELVVARSKDKSLQLCSMAGIVVEGLLSHASNSFDFQSEGPDLGILLTVVSGVDNLPPTADVAGVGLTRLSQSFASSYAFMAPNPTAITDGSLYPLTIGQETCLLRAHRQPI